jgi:hypothetical protein
MNQEFLENALKIIDEMTDEELFESLKAFGIDVTIRQYPEQENNDAQTL